jgi:hypothetical protein
MYPNTIHANGMPCIPQGFFSPEKLIDRNRQARLVVSVLLRIILVTPRGQWAGEIGSTRGRYGKLGGFWGHFLGRRKSNEFFQQKNLIAPLAWFPARFFFGGGSSFPPISLRGVTHMISGLIHEDSKSEGPNQTINTDLIAIIVVYECSFFIPLESVNNF